MCCARCAACLVILAGGPRCHQFIGIESRSRFIVGSSMDYQQSLLMMMEVQEQIGRMSMMVIGSPNICIARLG